MELSSNGKAQRLKRQNQPV